MSADDITTWQDRTGIHRGRIGPGCIPHMQAEIDELRAYAARLEGALSVAADAFDILDDHGFGDVQVYPPPEWGIQTKTEDPAQGWAATSSLAEHFRALLGALQ